MHVCDTMILKRHKNYNEFEFDLHASLVYILKVSVQNTLNNNHCQFVIRALLRHSYGSRSTEHAQKADAICTILFVADEKGKETE